jgi:hypothetical protein
MQPTYSLKDLAFRKQEERYTGVVAVNNSENFPRGMKLTDIGKRIDLQRNLVKRSSLRLVNGGQA